MLIAGSDGGIHRIDGIEGQEEATVERVFDPGPVVRLRAFDGVDGAFAATETGLYRSADGETWTDLGVPRERAYAVGDDPRGETVRRDPSRPRLRHASIRGDRARERPGVARRLTGEGADPLRSRRERSASPRC